VSDTLNGASGVGGLLFISEGLGITTNYYCVANDGNGNVVGLIGEDGSLMGEYSYGPFGETLKAQGDAAVRNTVRWSTEYFDTVTGLAMYDFRPYEPGLGRWWAKDRIGYQGGMNLYGYCGNDGVNRWDLWGLAWNIKRDSQYSLAVAIPDSESDTFKTLADRVKLSYDERTLWIYWGGQYDQ